MSVSLTCPKCGETNNVQSVKALVQSESVQGYGIGYPVESSLARMLARPLPPKYENENDGPFALAIGCMAFYLVGGLVSLVFANWSKITGSELGLQDPVSIVAVASAISLAGAIAVGWLFQRATHKRMEEATAATRAQNARARRRFESATQRWDNSFYCRRCGSVYIPGQKTFVQAERMHDLLYQ